MTIQKLSLIEHLKNPFTFKTPAGTTERLIRSQRITAVALFILGLSLAIVGGPLIFYAYTASMKSRRFKQIEKELEQERKLPLFEQLIKKVVPRIPDFADKFRAVNPLSEQVKTLLDQCKKAKNEDEQRIFLLQLGGVLDKLKKTNNDIHNRLQRFLEKKEGDSAAQGQVCKALDELKRYEWQVDYAFNDLSALIQAFPINAQNLDQEVKLLNVMPVQSQHSRLQRLLRTQFEIHPIGGNGACGAHSLANGIWPHLLELRKTDREQAMREEARLALQLRHEVIDWIEENVKNVIHNEANPKNLKKNSDGSEPFDFRIWCMERPGPEGRLPEEISFEDYIKEMRQPYTWFGQGEVTAAAQKYRKRIETYAPGCVEVANNRLKLKENVVLGAEFATKPICLYQSGGHYEIMTPKVPHSIRPVGAGPHR